MPQMWSTVINAVVLVSGRQRYRNQYNLLRYNIDPGTGYHNSADAQIEERLAENLLV